MFTSFLQKFEQYKYGMIYQKRRRENCLLNIERHITANAGYHNETHIHTHTQTSVLD